jgi:hypothetical protein
MKASWHVQILVGWLGSDGCIWDHLTHFAFCFPIENNKILALLHLEEVCTFLLGSFAKFVTHFALPRGHV